MSLIFCDPLKMLERLEELTAYIENFPGGPLAPIFEKEIAELKKYL